MIKAEKRAAIHRWHETMSAAIATRDQVDKALGLEPEGPLSTLFDTLMSDLTSEVSRMVGDEVAWLAWYWMENEMGAGAMKVTINYTDTRKVATVDDLIWVLELEGE